MIGDRLVFEPCHFKKRDLIFKKTIESIIDQENPSRFVLTIGGSSGTGKTEIAILLQEALFNDYGIQSYVISLDDYYKVPWLERREYREKKGIESVGIKEINWRKVNDLINFYLNSIHIYIRPQKIHKFINDIEYSKVRKDSIDVLIIEGLYACDLKKSNLSVFLEGDYKDTEEFRVKRNKEIRDSFRLSVLKKEQKDVEKTKEQADMFVPYKTKGKIK